MLRKIVIKIQSLFVKRLISKFDLKLVVVVGSVGKTTTKLAIGHILDSAEATCVEQGNYNDLLSWSLPAFGQKIPSLRNPFAWLKRFWGMFMTVSKKSYPYKILVCEWGIDGIGKMEKYGYVRPDILVVSAISEEHIEQFGDVDTAAYEELLACKFAKKLLVNSDSVDEKYRSLIGEHKTYGTHGADYLISNDNMEPIVVSTDQIWLSKKTVRHQVVGKHMRLALTAGLAVADILGLGSDKVLDAVHSFRPYAGRMQRLDGRSGALVIDDTYNSTPLAVEAGLSAVYELEYKQKIAVLGSMNELGGYAEEAHKRVGRFCDPNQLDEVVTVGEMAKSWLAPEAVKRGCKVTSFDSPYAAGLYLKSLAINKLTLVYAKGSQNKVYVEEAIRQILAWPEDRSLLVRQSDEWLKIKQSQFADYIP